MKQKILVTGHQGYIGAVLVQHLLGRGYDVVGLDTGYFADCRLDIPTASIPTIDRDLRDVTAEDVSGIDAIVHLGALSNDPIGNLRTDWTTQINHEATVRLAKLAKAAGVRRFLFSSSCIMYGMSEAEWVDETTALAPVTEYARSKVAAERDLSALADDTFSPVFIRNGTVYGLSPVMRLDTVLNIFVTEALTTGKVVVLSDGKPWRPVIHLRDLVRTFALFLEAPIEAIHNQAFNNGADHLNYQIGTIAQAAVSAVPGATLSIEARTGADQRTYRASFAKFAKTFPDFKFEWSPETGAIELAKAFTEIGFTREDAQSGKFVRLTWLNKLLNSGELDQDLRWTKTHG